MLFEIRTDCEKNEIFLKEKQIYKRINFALKMKSRFLHFIEKHNLFKLNEKVLVAVSGGIDSMVLVDLFVKTQIPFIIAHCNFELRGVESDGDELFVQSIANKHKILFLSRCFNTVDYASSKNISIQIAARELRYEWFNELAKTHACSSVVLAHHADDVAETMLINLCRGTGLAGVHGILPRNGLFVRPLLFAQRTDIVEYANEHHIKFREDSSNIKDKYARNNIRHHVIPALKKSFPEAVLSFNKSASIITAQEIVYRNAIREFAESALTETSQHTAISIEKVMQFIEPEIGLFELLNPFGYNSSQVSDILANIIGQAGAIYLSPTHQLIRDRKFLFITLLNQNSEVESFQINSLEDTKHLPIKLNFEKLPKEMIQLKLDNPSEIILDASKLIFPITLRKWTQGDSFRPIGMRGRKKVSDFFQDLKIPTHIKSHIYLLESNKEIIWIVGYRMCDSIKITKTTKDFLKISVD